MKNFTLLILLLSFSYVVSAQQMFLDLGTSSTSISYLNSSGESLDNLQPTSNNLMQFGYKYSRPQDFLSYTLAASYAGYGAIGSDSLYTNYMEYRLNYLQFHTGVDVRVLSFQGFDISFKTNISFGFLLQGTQTLNNQVFDLTQSDDFDKMLLSLAKGVSVSRTISESTSIYIQFMNDWGIPAGVERTEDIERWHFHRNSLSFGLLIDLNN